MADKNKTGPDEVPEEQRPADRASQPAALSPARRGMTATAIAAELAAELLQAMGRDGLAVAAKAIAHLLHLIAVFRRQDGQM